MFDYYGNNDRCFLWIVPTNSPFSIIGMPVFVDYYSIHEPKTGAVHWAPHTNSPKDTVVSGPAPTGKFLTIGEISTTSATDLLLEYAMSAIACYASIYYWQYYVYPELVQPARGYSDQ